MKQITDDDDLSLKSMEEHKIDPNPMNVVLTIEKDTDNDDEKTNVLDYYSYPTNVHHQFLSKYLIDVDLHRHHHHLQLQSIDHEVHLH